MHQNEILDFATRSGNLFRHFSCMPPTHALVEPPRSMIADEAIGVPQPQRHHPTSLAR